MNDTDPMLGDKSEQDDYRQKIAAMMRAEADKIREDRRTPATTRETQPVMLGNVGFDNGISTA